MVTDYRRLVYVGCCWCFPCRFACDLVGVFPAGLCGLLLVFSLPVCMCPCWCFPCRFACALVAATGCCAFQKLNDMGKHNTVINTRKVDQKDAARTVCLEFEQGEGRRRPRYRKPQMISTLWARRKVFVADETLPPPHQRVVWKEQKPM